MLIKSNLFANNQKGQILIIFLGIMGVALGVGLAMNQRAVVSLRQGNRAVTSAQAYYSAEAGAEAALVDENIATCTESVPCVSDIGDCAYSYYSELSSDLEISLGKDKVLALDTESSGGINVTLKWNKSASCGTENGLEIVEVYDSGGLQTKKSAFSCCRSPTPTGFTDKSTASGDYNCSASYALDSASRKLFIKMLYAGGTGPGSIAVSGLSGDQALVVKSLGSCGAGSNAISRTLKITKLLKSSGQDFTFGLFAPEDDLDLN